MLITTELGIIANDAVGKCTQYSNRKQVNCVENLTSVLIVYTFLIDRSSTFSSVDAVNKKTLRFLVSCSSESEMEKWMEDLKMAVDMAEESNGSTSDPLTPSKDLSKSHIIPSHISYKISLP